MVQRVESSSPEGHVYYKLILRPKTEDEYQGWLAFEVTKEEYDRYALDDAFRVKVTSLTKLRPV